MQRLVILSFIFCVLPRSICPEHVRVFAWWKFEKIHFARFLQVTEKRADGIPNRPGVICVLGPTNAQSRTSSHQSSESSAVDHGVPSVSLETTTAETSSKTIASSRNIVTTKQPGKSQKIASLPRIRCELFVYFLFLISYFLFRFGYSVWSVSIVSAAFETDINQSVQSDIWWVFQQVLNFHTYFRVVFGLFWSVWINVLFLLMLGLLFNGAMNVLQEA